MLNEKNGSKRSTFTVGRKEEDSEKTMKGGEKTTKNTII